MQIKTIAKQIVPWGIFIGAVIFSVIYFYSVSIKLIQNNLVMNIGAIISAPKIEESLASTGQISVNTGVPLHLLIPNILVDVSVESVGITSDGLMDIPKDPENVAWFNLGQHPGMEGTAVIAGHYGWKEEKVVAFDRLNELQKGDKIYVEDDSGVTTTFVVRETRSYSPSDDATEVFSSNDGISHLNLITCQGIWNKVTKNYSKRLVVFADRE